MGFKLLKMYITKRSKRSKSVGRMFLAHTTHPPTSPGTYKKVETWKKYFFFLATYNSKSTINTST